MLPAISTVFVLLVWLLATYASGSGAKTPLYFSYITTLTGDLTIAGAIPAVDLALEQINNRQDILVNYTLGYTSIRDSKCSRTVSLNAFMEDFRNSSQPTYVSLIGCGCSTATIPVAEISHYWNIPQISAAAGAFELNDQRRFRNFFRTLPSYEFVAPSLLRIAQQFGWRQMVVITQSESVFMMTTQRLSRLFRSNGLLLETSAMIRTNSNPFPYDKVFNWRRDYRIIIINAFQVHAARILCEAYFRGMTAPRFVWLIPSWYERSWWRLNYGNSTCTQQIMRSILNNSLTYIPEGYFVSDSDDKSAPTVSGLTVNEFDSEYIRRLQEPRYRVRNLRPTSAPGLLYDAVWAMAIALQNVSERVRRNDSSGCTNLSGELVPLEQFDYENELMGCLMRNSYYNITFSGITGTIAFNENGTRFDNTIILHQYRTEGANDLRKHLIAEVVTTDNRTSFTFRRRQSVVTIWQADSAPYDGTPQEVLHLNHISLVVIYSIFAISGLVFTIVCLLFTLIFREKKVVKLSSPNLNLLIIAGAALLYISVFFYIFTATDESQALLQTLLCNFRQLLSSLGYTLCFGVILAKTWRVYYIFNKPTMKKKKLLKDWIMFIFVFIVVAVDIAIIMIGTAVPAARLNATLVEDIQHPTAIDDEGINYNQNIFVCINSNTIIWLAISYAYKGLLQLVAMFMAFHIRRVKIKALNDSKEIAVLIYINSIILVLLAVVEFALNTYHEVYAALFGLGLMVGATLFLTLAFIPKMIYLIMDPTGEKALESSSNQDNSTFQTKMVTKDVNASVEQLQENNMTLKQKVSELEEKLTKLTNSPSHVANGHLQ